MHGAGPKYTENRGEWILGSLQHTKNEQQRAQEAEQILKVAIQEEQASIQDKSKKMIMKQ